MFWVKDLTSCVLAMVKILTSLISSFRNIYLIAIVPDVWIHMILEPMEIHYYANNVLMESIVHPLGNVINVNLNEIYPYK